MAKKIKITLPDKLQQIIGRINTQDGKCFLVGGGVIDSIKRQPIKDWDIEVFNKSYDDLLVILKDFGDCDLIGKKFGIIKFKTEESFMKNEFVKVKVGENYYKFKVIEIEISNNKTIFITACDIGYYSSIKKIDSLNLKNFIGLEVKKIIGNE